MKKKIVFIFSGFSLLFCCKFFAQNVGINNQGLVANSKAMLDVSSTTSGLLIPRMTQVQRDAIASPPTSLLIYQTNSTPGYYYYDGFGWVNLLSGTATGWSLTGNVGTTAGTNFIGTTDAIDWVVKTNNNERMRVLSGGNVGIGTLAPSAKLDVNGTGGSTIDLNVSGRIRSNSTSGGLWLSDTGDGFVGNTSANIGFWTSGVGWNALQIEKTSGNVSIGTTVPLQKLHVVGNGRIQGNFLEIGAGLTGNRNAYIDFVGDDINTDYGLRIFRNSTGPNAYSIFYHRGTSPFYISAQDAADVIIRTDNTDRLTIKPTTGNVGIGTTSPSAKLDVAGKTETTNFQMTTGATNGYILQSDASGNATWVDPASVGSGSLNFTPVLDGITWYTNSASGVGGGGEGEYKCSTPNTVTIADPAVPSTAKLALIQFRHAHSNQSSSALKVFNMANQTVAYLGQAGRGGDGRSFYSGGMAVVPLTNKQFKMSHCMNGGTSTTWYYTIMAYLP